jgi:hypothetical protein
VLLQVEIKIISVTIFQHCTEGVVVDCEQVEEADNPWMVQWLVDVFLAHCVFDVVCLLVLLPVLVHLMYFAGDIAIFVQVESSPDLTVKFFLIRQPYIPTLLPESAFAQQWEEQIPVVQKYMFFETTLLLALNPFHFPYVEIALALQSIFFYQ